MSDDDEMRPIRTVVRFTVDVLLPEDADSSDVSALDVSAVHMVDGLRFSDVIQSRCQEARLVVSDV